MRGKALVLLVPLLVAGASPNKITTKGIVPGAESPPDDQDVVLRVLNAGGGQPTAISSLYSYFPSSLQVGAYWDLRGDGSSSTGGVPLAPQHIPSGTAVSMCPNGANCASVISTEILKSQNQYWDTIGTAAPTGDFTVCAVFRMNLNAEGPTLISKDDGATNRAILLYVNTSGVLNFCVSSATTGITCTGSQTVTTGAWHMACATYHYVADLSSVATPYLDGVAAPINNTMPGPVKPTATIGWAIGARAGGPALFSGAIREAFFTESLLSGTTLAAMANAMNATPLQGSWGETLPFTGATAYPCYDSAGGLTILPPGRVCVSKGGIGTGPQIVTLNSRGDEMDNAAWTKGDVTVTADTTVGPNWSHVYDTISDTTANAAHQIFQTVTPVTNETYQVQAKAGTLSYIRLADNSTTHTAVFNLATCATNGTGGAGTTSTATASANGFCRCTMSAPVGVGGALMNIQLSRDGGTYSYPGIGETVILGDAMAESNTFASSYCPNFSSTATCNARQSSGPAVTLGNTPSIAATIQIDNSVTSTHFVASAESSTTQRWELYINTSDKAICEYFNGTARAVTSAGTVPTGSPVRLACSYDGTNIQVCVAGACTQSAVSFTPTATTFNATYFGWYGSGAQNWWPDTISDVCYSSSPWGCQ